MFNKCFGLLITVAISSAPLSAFAQQGYGANTQYINNLTDMFQGAMDGRLPANGGYRPAGEPTQPTNNAVRNFNQSSQSIIDNYQRTINNNEAQYGQNFANEKMAICAQLNAGKNPRQLTIEWAQYFESLISMNQFRPEHRNQAYQFFGTLTDQAVRTYCPNHMQALIEAQSAPSSSYQAPSRMCNFNVATVSPNNSTYTNAGNAWVNWFNNFGGKWMPRITSKTTQQLYGCQ